MSNALLPEAGLRAFLEAYPHPAFALAAVPLFEALYTRQSLTAHDTRFDQRSSSPARAASPYPAAQLPDSASKSSSAGSKTASSSSEKERILQKGFDPSPSPPIWMLTDQQETTQVERTAEGAVAAMYAAKAADEGVQKQQSLDVQASQTKSNATAAVVEPLHGSQATMLQFLGPTWTNPAFQKFFAVDGEANDTWGLLDVLAVDQVQVLLGMLTAAVGGLSKAEPRRPSQQTATIRFDIPPSKHAHPLAARDTHRNVIHRFLQVVATLHDNLVILTSTDVEDPNPTQAPRATQTRPPLKPSLYGDNSASSNSTLTTGSTNTETSTTSLLHTTAAANAQLSSPGDEDKASHLTPFSILPDGSQVNIEHHFVSEKDRRKMNRSKRRAHIMEHSEVASDHGDSATFSDDRKTPSTEHDEGAAGLSLAYADAGDGDGSTVVPLSPPVTPMDLPTPLANPFDPADPFVAQLRSTPVGNLILNYPWQDSPLGHIHTWKREIKVLVSLTLACPYRAAIWLGHDHIILYNDAYAAMAGEKHPSLLGSRASRGWAEIWDEVGPLAARVMQGETIAAEDNHLTMFRHGFLEETYHTWSWIPFRGENEILGYFNVAFESTARVIAERRLATIRDVVLASSNVRTTQALCDNVLDSLSKNSYDLPFVLLYSCEPVKTKGKKAGVMLSQSGGSATDGSVRLQLSKMGTIGVPKQHPSAPSSLAIQVDSGMMSRNESETDSTSGMERDSVSNDGDSTKAKEDVWPWNTACSSRKPVFVEELGKRADGFEPRGWKDPPKHAVVIPVYAGTDEALPTAILIVGLNPRRPFNDIFASFLHLLAQQVSAGFLAVTNAERDQRKVQELAALNKARTTFAQNINHELRTPIQLILGPLEDVLQSHYLGDGDRERLVTVKRNANRLLGMVNTLLDYSQVESGQSTHSFRPTNISALTSDLASLFRSAIESGGLEFVVDCEPYPEEQDFYTSPELYEKVVFNLLSNAFKFTSNGWIEVSIKYTKEEAILTVADSGCGIAEENLTSIFERFHRVNSTARSHEGTGIGLSLTFEVAKALGGRMSVESELGNGSKFTVYLPRGTAHLPSDRIVEDPADISNSQSVSARAKSSLAAIEAASSFDSPRQISQGETPDTDISSVAYDMSTDWLKLRNSTIVLCDDNADLRHYISSILSKNYHVIPFADGETALPYILEHPPALVLTDIMMPKLNGNELLAKLRGDSRTSLIPIIFLSAQAGDEARATALDSGADDYLVKPFASRELLARVNVHLQLGKMRMELERRVTERTRELYESEIRYRSLADRYSTLSMLSPVGIFMTDEYGVISYTNPRFSELAQLPEGAPPTAWVDNVDPDDWRRVEGLWADAVAQDLAVESQTVRTFEFRWKTGNWALLEIQPFQGESAAFTPRRGFVGAFTDITTIKHLESKHIDAVEARARDSEEARRAQEAFIDLLSHELRNPVRSPSLTFGYKANINQVSAVINSAQLLRGSGRRLQTFLRTLRQGQAPSQDMLSRVIREAEEDAESVDAIAISAAHQAAIAGDILQVSKLNLGLLSISPVDFDITAKVADVLKIFESECQQKHIELLMHIDESVDVRRARWIKADEVRVAQVLINYLTNSVKYTNESAVKRIIVHVEAFADIPPARANARRITSPTAPQASDEMLWISLSVEDSGRGLSPDELNLLFERFVQARPRTDQFGGAGLGLYVARRLSDLQNGMLEVESAINHGSTFRFAIPVTRAQPSTHDTSDNGQMHVSAAISPPSEHTTTTKVAPLHVLIVEDNLINQKVMSRQLKLLGLTVSVANNGQEAVDAVLKDETDKRFGIVLMDIEMPVMNGLTAASEIRRLEREGIVKRRLPLVAVTGNARAESVEACMTNGFDRVQTKPYKIESLVETMEQLTGTVI